MLDWHWGGAGVQGALGRPPPGASHGPPPVVTTPLDVVDEGPPGPTETLESGGSVDPLEVVDPPASPSTTTFPPQRTVASARPARVEQTRRE